ncbi:MAG TPA: GatB/YqeY domain-containing protein, partial [Nitrososphaera sp.]|nr:GatB/YqeY domain-containing protein [Nitrososphaera sp.]
PKDRVGFASEAIVNRLKAATAGVPAETRAATPDGRTVFLRPRPGAARMYPETDLMPITVNEPMLASLVDKVPKSWDEVITSLMEKYGLKETLAKEIFDSDYLGVFEEIAGRTKIQPTFVASKLTEDITSLQRQGMDPSALADDAIKDVFAKLDSGSIAKESVILIFEKLMKKQAGTVDEAIKAAGISSISDEELSAMIDKVISENMAAVREKGANSLGMLMGRVMAVARGKADGQKINAMLKEKMQKLVNQ